MTDGTWNRKGIFEMPPNCRSLIDWFLDPDLRRARHRVNQRIEARAATPAMASVGKALAGITALQEQAKRNRVRA